MKFLHSFISSARKPCVQSTTIFLCLLGCTVLFAQYWTPSIRILQADPEGRIWSSPVLPITWQVHSGVEEKKSAIIHIRGNHFQTNFFIIKADDCIESLSVNDKNILEKRCAYSQEERITLGGLIQKKNNIVRVTIKNRIFNKMSFDLSPSTKDDMLWIVITVAIATLFIWYSLTMLQILITKDTPILIIAAMGSILRITYSLSTPYDGRSYDAWAHIDYIRYLADHLWIPPAGMGWEFHQAPIYYWLMSFVLRGTRYFGWSDTLSFQWMQWVSVALSITTMLLAFWIGKKILGNEHAQRLRLFAGFMATLPGLVMFSSRISNDTLLTPLVFLSFSTLLLWYENPTIRRYLAVSFILGAAFLTKLSGLIPVGGAALVLLLHPTLPKREKVRQAIAGAFLFLALTSWLPIARFTEDPYNVSNLINLGKNGINPALKLEKSLPRFLVFNPIEILRHPFNNTYADEERRQYAQEFFFRSMFFGEFSRSEFALASLSTWILHAALLLLPWALAGMFTLLLAWENQRPLILMTITVSLGACMYAYFFPYAPEQDFRFSPFLAIPFSFAIMTGIATSTRKTVRFVGSWIVGILCLLQLIFLAAELG